MDLPPDFITVVADCSIAEMIISVDNKTLFKNLRFFGRSTTPGASFDLASISPGDELPVGLGVLVPDPPILLATVSIKLWIIPVVFCVMVTACPLSVCTRRTLALVASENTSGSALGVACCAYTLEALEKPAAIVSPMKTIPRLENY